MPHRHHTLEDNLASAVYACGCLQHAYEIPRWMDRLPVIPMGEWKSLRASIRSVMGIRSRCTQTHITVAPLYIEYGLARLAPGSG
jgi:hypothetical protein